MSSWDDWLKLNPDTDDGGDVYDSDVLLYRVDISLPERFEPRLPKSALEGECQTIPRICASESLVHAIVGYNKILYDVTNAKGIAGMEYKILALKVPGCYIPNNSLVPNANITKEHWIVNYNGELPYIEPSNVGSCFVKTTFIDHGKVSDSDVSISYNFYISANDNIIIFDKLLNAGYYKLNLTIRTKLNGIANDPPSSFEVLSVNQINVDDYLKALNNSISIENYYQ